MFRKLKTAIRRWLEVDQEEDDFYLDCVVPGQGLQRFVITGLSGMRLVGRPTDGRTSSVRLIGEGEAVDPAKFDRLRRRYLLGSGRPLVWDDGTPYQP